MLLYRSSALTLSAWTALLQAAELPAQGNLGSNPPDVYSRGFHCHGFHKEIFPGEVVSPQTSMPATQKPSTHSYLHQPPHFGQKRKFAMCGMSPPSPLFLFPSHTITGYHSYVGEKCHLWLYPSKINFMSFKPYSSRPLHLACLPPSIHYVNSEPRPPRAIARRWLCVHILYTWPIILAMSPTLVQLQQSWIGPCSPSETETATAYIWSSDCYTMKPFTHLLDSGLCVENNCYLSLWLNFLSLYHF